MTRDTPTKHGEQPIPDPLMNYTGPGDLAPQADTNRATPSSTALRAIHSDWIGLTRTYERLRTAVQRSPSLEAQRSDRGARLSALLRSALETSSSGRPSAGQRGARPESKPSSMLTAHIRRTRRSGRGGEPNWWSNPSRGESRHRRVGQLSSPSPSANPVGAEERMAVMQHRVTRMRAPAGGLL
jgi:hypothetical protein